MAHRSIDPATGRTCHEEPDWDAARVESAVAASAATARTWAALSVAARAAHAARLADELHARRAELAALATREMGKLAGEALAEVDKCVLGCRYYAEHGPHFLADELIASDAGRSLVTHAPLGTLLAVMPWNFPFWQAVRAAVPALVAGNTVLLKHAPNVPLCARALQECFDAAGFPSGAYTTLFVDVPVVSALIADPRVHAVTLTGSERAGRAVAALAGQHLKKMVLELGGSDAFIVLDDADPGTTVAQAVRARFQNCGQSCIAAKRFLVTPGIAEPFLAAFTAAVAALTPGDPADPATTLAPMARADLRDALHAQVEDARRLGARVLTGGQPLQRPGAYYAPTVLDGVTPAMRAWREELFGPVATVIRVADAEEALAVANASPYGLGGSVWTGDSVRGEALARRLATGMAFVNGMVRSDPRLPFGGVKASGMGRELGPQGIREFVNTQTLWIA